jgi:hypothetical protein
MLAGAVVVAASHKGGAHRTAAADGDLQRDLQLASTSSLELAPTTSALTVSPVEETPPAAPERTLRPKRSSTGSRAVHSRKPTVKAAPEPEVAAAEEPGATEATTVASSTEATAEAPAEGGGVALPRPTAVPISVPAGGAAGPGTERAPDSDRGGGGILGGIFGTVLRGGGVDGDNCQIRRPGGTYYPPPAVYFPPPGGIAGGRVIARPPRDNSPAGRVSRAVGGGFGGGRGASAGSSAGRVAGALGRRH